MKPAEIGQEKCTLKRLEYILVFKGCKSWKITQYMYPKITTKKISKYVP